MTWDLTPRYLHKWNENLGSQTYVNIYIGPIHNCQELETRQMSLNWVMDKQTVAHPYMEYSSAIKRNITDWHMQIHGRLSNA